MKGPPPSPSSKTLRGGQSLGASFKARGSAASEAFEREAIQRAGRAMQQHPGPELGKAGSWVASMRRARRGLSEASLVSPHLVIGDKDDAADAARLSELGVTHVLNAAAGSLPSPFASSFVYLKLNLEDHEDFDIAPHFKVGATGGGARGP